MVKISWAIPAKRSLKELHEYIAVDSKSNARKVSTTIMSEVNRLKTFPKMGRMVPEFNMEDIRELICFSYRIIYHIASENRISVVSIYHGRQDISDPDRILNLIKESPPHSN